MGRSRQMVPRSPRPSRLVRVVDDGYALFEAGETRLALLARKNSGEASPRWSLGFEIDNLDLVAQRLLEAGSQITRPA